MTKSVLAIFTGMALIALASEGIPVGSHVIGSSALPPRLITICKQTCPVTNQLFSFAWANVGTGSGQSIIFSAGQCRTWDVTNMDPSNSYTENVPPGWKVSNISCAYSTSAVGFSSSSSGTFHPAFQPGDKSVRIVINETNVTCTFFNERNCLQPPSGMASWWTGDGVATDHVGGTGGALVGNVTYAPGKVAQAFKIMQGYVEVPDNPLHTPSGSFTVDAWIHQTNQFGPYYVVSKYECGGFCGSPNPAYSTYQLRVLHTRAQAVIRDSDGAGSGVSQTLTGPSVVDGQWHHLAMVRDVSAGRFFLYVDGALAASTPLNAGTDGPMHNDDGMPDALYIGAIKRAGNQYAAGGVANMEGFFLGMIDEVEYFNRALTPGEIASIRNADAAGKCKN